LVYPHYLAPLPSMAIVEFQADLTEGSLSEGYRIPRGTVLRGQLPRGEQTACDYRTAHEVTLWPLRIAAADYFGRNVAAIALPGQLQKLKAGLRLRLQATAGLNFSQLPLERLQIHLRGDEVRSHRLYEQLFANARAILIRPVGDRSWHEVLPADTIGRVGFEEDQALLPYGPQSFSGYRLINEYFAFAPRFLFFELTELAKSFRRCEANEIEIIILFDRVDSQLENLVDADQLALFCSPAVNLFPRRLDRIHLDFGEVEHHVIPDRTRPMDIEVYQITNVEGFGDEGTEPRPVRSFYTLNEHDHLGKDANLAYYTTRREPRLLSSRQRRAGPRSSYVGSELFLTLVDGNHAPYGRDLQQLDIQALCTNRDLPLLMPIGLGRTDFTMELGAPVSSVRVVSGPSRPRPPLVYGDGSQAWRLVNHLSLDYLSLADRDSEHGAVVLRELLGLYADPVEADLMKQIEGVRSVRTQPIVRRMPVSGPISFARGLEIELLFDEVTFGGSGGVFLLGAVLSEFFTRYATVNSFTETILKTTDRGEIMRWPTKIGKRQLI
ncbi:MAG TPA: type VI secretion system baseplate subunit TssF, partial [Pirellulaceae bacterium]|nr:type VI secretion system baseplate subunit TssF [Pirellulaceae bacterium]